MSRSKKKQYKPDIYASVGVNDNFGCIYDGMLKSKAFQELHPGAKIFYVICRVQAQTSKGKQCLFMHGQDADRNYNEKCDFVFPAKHMREYGYKRENGHKYLQELIEAGFIEKKECNKPQKKVNVYSFSTKWKERHS